MATTLELRKQYDSPNALHPAAWPWTGRLQGPAHPGETSAYQSTTCLGCHQDWQWIDFGCARHALYHPAFADLSAFAMGVR